MKSVTTLLLLFCGSGVFAQKASYLKADVGFGRSAVRETVGGTRTPGWTPVAGNRFALTGGVQVKKLSVEIGFGYGQTGGRRSETILRTSTATGLALAPTVIGATRSIRHLTLPVSMGYDFRAGKRWALQPRLGFEGAFTAASKLRDSYVSDNSEAFYTPLQHRPLKQLSLHATGSLQFHYRVTPSVSVFGGPSYRYMITNGARAAETTSYSPYNLHTSSATMDAGVLLRLPTKSGTVPGLRAPQE